MTWYFEYMGDLKSRRSCERWADTFFEKTNVDLPRTWMDSSHRSFILRKSAFPTLFNGCCEYRLSHPSCNGAFHICFSMYLFFFVLKGIVAWDISFSYLNLYRKMIQDLNFSPFCRKFAAIGSISCLSANRRNRRMEQMELQTLFENWKGKCSENILLAYSPCTFKYFPLYVKNTVLNHSYSSYIVNYFWRIFHVRQNTFMFFLCNELALCVQEEYAERLK
jgi:hypothetical protein